MSRAAGVFLRLKPYSLIGFSAFLVFVSGPFIYLCFETISHISSNDGWYEFLIPSGRKLTLLLNSLRLSLSVTISGTVIGILTAGFLWSLNNRIIRYARWLLLILVPLPPYIHALAWSSFFNSLNGILTSLNVPVIDFNGFAASWWVQLMALLPAAVSFILVGLESIDRELIEAGQVLKPDFTVYLKILLPICKPFIMAGAGFIFIMSIIDYSVASLFQYSSYAFEIFVEYSAGNEPAASLLLSLPIITITLAALFLSQSGIKNIALRQCNAEDRRRIAFNFPLYLSFLQYTAFSVLLLQVTVPLLTIVLNTDMWKNFIYTVNSSLDVIKVTLAISLLSATASLIPAFYAAKKLRKSGVYRIWWILILIPATIPAPLAGIGLIGIWNRPGFDILSDSIILPVLGCLVRFTPFAALIILSGIRNIDSSLIDAAKMLQKNAIHTLVKIKLPLLLPGLLAAFFTVFILSAGELGASLILIPPGCETLTLKIYNYMHYGASDTVSGLCLIMVIMTVCSGLSGVVALKAGRSWFK